MTGVIVQPIDSADVQDDVDYLLGLDAAEFAAFVLAHLGREEPERIWRVLCHPDLRGDTADVLARKVREVELQEQTRGVEFSGDAGALSEWRVKAGGFRRMLERRLRQVEAAATDGDLLALVRELAVAVNRHRLACVDADLAPEPHDTAPVGVAGRAAATGGRRGRPGASDVG